MSELPGIEAALLGFLLGREPDEIGPGGVMRYQLDALGEVTVETTVEGQIVFGNEDVRWSVTPDSAVALCQAILSCHSRMELGKGVRS